MASLFELESELQRLVKKQPFASLAPIKDRKRRRAPAKTAKSGNGNGSYPTRAPSPTAGGPAVVAGAPKAASLSSPIDYRVPGIVAPLAQPSSLTCWATVTTMMISWRESASMAIDAALTRAGQQYVDKFRRNEGLSSAEKAPFLAAVGLIAEPPMNHAIEGWERMLRTYGPLWVTTDEQGGAGFSIHARIITGIHGNGAATDTFFDIVDPAGGRQYRERFADFLGKYEEEPSHSKRSLRIQVVHWPSNALMSGQKSYGEMVTGRRGFSTDLSDKQDTVSYQFGGPLAAAELGVAIFQAGQAILSSGDLSYEWAEASYVHPHTPPETPATKASIEMKLVAYHPRYFIDDQKFFFELEFEYNGYDLKRCRINLLRGKSSSLHASTFNIKFRPTAANDPNDQQAQILYMIEGRWDAVGRGDASFKGDLLIKANGDVSLSITANPPGWVYVTKDSFSSARRTPLPVPASVTSFHDVFFSPEGSAKVNPKAEKELLDWLEGNIKTDRIQFEKGRIPILVEGHASTTGTKNQELSRQRAEAVEKIIRDVVGRDAKIEVRAHGERKAGTPDEVKDPTKQRVRVEIKRYLKPK